ncbi:hypothetical protein CAPTEDRAFT_217947 [Capitella teleta]|uniref:G-protein coupled receptors family 1 profile domain-containing protein n=1 Tax=Capitella teleta TaxID=283909 RepID=R7UPH5_CAPTE|nr:hypothetical protein CAPTEDRAFT_217947 [Capitella teleta]|eukprot:ELU08429.1 hypothetical protein CAPTEDRAFT_217947 [Capitella teleta]
MLACGGLNASTGVWVMPSPLVHTAAAVIGIEALLSLTLNTILIATINHSPNLKTPPNSLLLNICVNNLVVVLSMVCSLVTLAESGDVSNSWLLETSTDLQEFLTALCFMQYWWIFAAIGHYRCKTLRKPALPLRVRCRIIYRTIVAGWVLSVLLALALALSFKGNASIMSWNSFRRCVNETETELLQHAPNDGQIAILALALVAVAACGVVIISSYFFIMKTLIKAQPVGNNRVSPWAVPPSISIDDQGGESDTNKRSYCPQNEPCSGDWKEPYCISNGEVTKDFVVHYSKSTQSLAVIENSALDNPLRTHQASPHLPLCSILPDAPHADVHNQQESARTTAFTDISPSAQLQRFQRMKNSCALRNQSWKRDRVSLTSATKNSMAMIVTFGFTSMPLLVCTIPGVLGANSTEHVSVTLLYCRLAFFLNSAVYPIWYLIFSKQVRKCFGTMIENMLIKLKLRQ